MSDPTEVWLRGPIPGYAPILQPIVHAFLQVSEEVERRANDLTHEQLWARPANVASVGFHLLHLAGATDRLLTYARAEPLTLEQITAMKAESTPLSEDITSTQLITNLQDAIARALEQVRTTPIADLESIRYVGRARLETTVLGLLFHAAEHASRHAGQLTTTAKLVRTMAD